MSVSLIQPVEGLKRTRLRVPGRREFSQETDLGLETATSILSGASRLPSCPAQDTLLCPSLSISLSQCLIFIYVYIYVHPSILLVLWRTLT